MNQIPTKIHTNRRGPEALTVTALVTSVSRGIYELNLDGERRLARLKTGSYRGGGELIPTAGDLVLADWQAEGECLIVRTLPRKTWFARLDPSSSGRGAQAVAANFDYVFIAQSMNRDFNPRRLERYAALAWQSGGTPVILLTKADEADDRGQYLLAAEKAAPGIDVFPISAKTGEGLELLSGYLAPGKTAVLLGSSGVGKSTLINALAGKPVMETGEIREKDGRGRHTTSRRQVIRLENGAMVIDTPGMRELGMWEAGDGLDKGFPDVEAFLGQCRFRDCRHQGEPGCAVAAAIRNGELAPERWESYQRLQDEARYADDRDGYLREKKKRLREISLSLRKMQKEAPDYRRTPCAETFSCKACGAPISPEDAGTSHRNHCPSCLASVHLDNRPGDRASLCRGIMDAAAIQVRKNGEWAVIHQCRDCGALSSNRIAADDRPGALLSLAMMPLKRPYPWDGGQAGNRRPQKMLPAGGQAPSPGSPSCPQCGRPLPGKPDGQGYGHCPGCLSGIHGGSRPGGSALPCKGTMEAAAVRIRGDGQWDVILRCRQCGALRSEPTRPEDNASLLISLSVRPLAAPPFPLWG